MAETKTKDSITLKWGTLKAWHIETPEAFEFLKQWNALGQSMSVMAQNDTPEQKALLCQMIDASDVDHVFLDWDGIYVSKQEAKDYIMNYGQPRERAKAQP
jgi:hypothetical protein